MIRVFNMRSAAGRQLLPHAEDDRHFFGATTGHGCRFTPIHPGDAAPEGGEQLVKAADKRCAYLRCGRCRMGKPGDHEPAGFDDANDLGTCPG